MYAAPEVLSKKYNHSADMWSAGIITYMLLTARLPWQGNWGVGVAELYAGDISVNEHLWRCMTQTLLPKGCVALRRHGWFWQARCAGSSANLRAGFSVCRFHKVELRCAGLCPGDASMQRRNCGHPTIYHSTCSCNVQFISSCSGAVQSLLQKDPQKRLRAEDALRHPWLQLKSAQHASDEPLGPSIVQRLQRFHTYNKFKQV